jgi:hypothetical protein
MVLKFAMMILPFEHADETALVKPHCITNTVCMNSVLRTQISKPAPARRGLAAIQTDVETKHLVNFSIIAYIVYTIKFSRKKKHAETSARKKTRRSSRRKVQARRRQDQARRRDKIRRQAKARTQGATGNHSSNRKARSGGGIDPDGDTCIDAGAKGKNPEAETGQG